MIDKDDRKAIAIAAMQGIASRYSSDMINEYHERLAKDAVLIADSLLRELSK